MISKSSMTISTNSELYCPTTANRSLYRSGLASTARSLLNELRKKSPSQATAPQTQPTPKQSPQKRSRSEDADDASPLTAIDEDDKAEETATAPVVEEALPEPKVPIAGDEGGSGFLFEVGSVQ